MCLDWNSAPCRCGQALVLRHAVAGCRTQCLRNWEPHSVAVRLTEGKPQDFRFGHLSISPTSSFYVQDIAKSAAVSPSRSCVLPLVVLKQVSNRFTRP